MAEDKGERARFQGWLLEEVRAWRDEGLIDEGLAASLEARYRAGADAGGSRIVTILAIFGAVLVGVGAILFVAAHWDGIPPAGKVALLLALVSGAYVAGYEGCLQEDRSPKVGAALLLLGGLLYGATIAQVAQIFHIDAHFPNGFLAWGLGLLPLVYVARSAPLLVLALIALGIWNVAEVSQGHRALPYLSGILGPTLRAWNPLFWPVVFGATLPAVTRFPSPAAAALLAIAFGSWLFPPVLSLGRLHVGPSLVAMAYCLTLVAAGRLARSRGPLATRLLDAPEQTGVAGMLAGTFLLCYPWSCEEYLKDVQRSLEGAGAAWGVPVALAVASVAVAAWLSSTMERREERLLALGLAAVGGVSVATWVLPLGEVSAALLFNAVYLAVMLGCIYAGVREGRGRLVNTGIFAFGAWVLARYFQWFWDLFDRGLFFLVGGVVLLAVAWRLERVRRELLEKAEEAAGSAPPPPPAGEEAPE